MGEKRATLKDVAERSGYALRTVKNVVAGKNSVGEPVREAVLKAMQELDYKPNFLASTLARNKTYLIAVVLLEGEGEHQHRLLEGLNRFAAQYEDYGLKLEYHQTPDRAHAQEVVLEEFYEREDLDGIILQPCRGSDLSRQINILMYSGKPVVVMETEVHAAEQVCLIGQNQTKLGRICAQLLGNYLRGCGTVLVLCDSCRDERVAGFTAYMLEHFPRIRLQTFSPEIPGGVPMEKILMNTRPDGIYDGTGTDLVLSTLLGMWDCQNTVVLTNHISYQNRQRMKDGLVDLMVGEEPDAVGYGAAEVLFRYLSASVIPQKRIYTKITILTSECL